MTLKEKGTLTGVKQTSKSFPGITAPAVRACLIFIIRFYYMRYVWAQKKPLLDGGLCRLGIICLTGQSCEKFLERARVRGGNVLQNMFFANASFTFSVLVLQNFCSVLLLHFRLRALL